MSTLAAVLGKKADAINGNSEAILGNKVRGSHGIVYIGESIH